MGETQNSSNFSSEELEFRVSQGKDSKQALMESITEGWLEYVVFKSILIEMSVWEEGPGLREGTFLTFGSSPERENHSAESWAWEMNLQIGQNEQSYRNLLWMGGVVALSRMFGDNK